MGEKEKEKELEVIIAAKTLPSWDLLSIFLLSLSFLSFSSVCHSNIDKSLEKSLVANESEKNTHGKKPNVSFLFFPFSGNRLNVDSVRQTPGLALQGG